MACRTSKSRSPMAAMEKAPSVPAITHPAVAERLRRVTAIHEIPPIHTRHDRTTARDVVSDREKALTKGKKSHLLKFSRFLITTRLRSIAEIGICPWPLALSHFIQNQSEADARWIRRSLICGRSIMQSTWRRCTGKPSSRWSLSKKRSLMGLAHLMRRRSWKRSRSPARSRGGVRREACGADFEGRLQRHAIGSGQTERRWHLRQNPPR